MIHGPAYRPELPEVLFPTDFSPPVMALHASLLERTTRAILAGDIQGESPVDIYGGDRARRELLVGFSMREFNKYGIDVGPVGAEHKAILRQGSPVQFLQMPEWDPVNLHFTRMGDKALCDLLLMGVGHMILASDPDKCARDFINGLTSYLGDGFQTFMDSLIVDGAMYSLDPLYFDRRRDGLIRAILIGNDEMTLDEFDGIESELWNKLRELLS